MLNAVYIVQRGDTMLSIARRRGMSLAELLTWNPDLANPNHIAIGHPIRARG